MVGGTVQGVAAALLALVATVGGLEAADAAEEVVALEQQSWLTGPCIDQAPALENYVLGTDLSLNKLHGYVFTDITYDQDIDQVVVGCKDPQGLYRFDPQGHYKGGTKLLHFGEIDGIAWVSEGVLGMLEGSQKEIFFIDLHTAPHVLEMGVAQVETISVKGLEDQSSGLDFLAYDSQSDAFLTIIDNGIAPRLLKIDRFGDFVVVADKLVELGIADVTGLYVEASSGYIFINSPGTITKLDPTGKTTIDESLAEMTPDLIGSLGLAMDSNFTVWAVSEADYMKGWTWTGCSGAEMAPVATPPIAGLPAVKTMAEEQQDIGVLNGESQVFSDKAGGPAEQPLTAAQQLAMIRDTSEPATGVKSSLMLPGNSAGAPGAQPASAYAAAQDNGLYSKAAPTPSPKSKPRGNIIARGRTKTYPKSNPKSHPYSTSAKRPGRNPGLKNSQKPVAADAGKAAGTSPVTIVALLFFMAFAAAVGLIRYRKKGDGSYQPYRRVPADEGRGAAPSATMAEDLDFGGGDLEDDFYMADSDQFAHRADAGFTQASAFAGVGLS